MVLALRDQWTVQVFTLGAPDEELGPEGHSKHLAYRYLTNQMQKIYQVYESLSSFPLGLLLIMVWMHSLNLFERVC